MMTRIVAVLAVLLLLAPDHAAAQDAQQSRDTQLMKIENASLRASIRIIADSAHAAGLPDRAIILEALKGALFSWPTDRIVAVAGERLNLLRSARIALGATATAEDLTAGAGALQSGARAETLTRLAGGKRNASLFVALGVLSELATLRVPVDVAERVVTRLTNAGAGDQDLTNFRSTVQSDIALGALPASAASARVEAAITVDVNGGPTIRATVPGRLPIPPEN
jgi:hypothetical protein